MFSSYLVQTNAIKQKLIYLEHPPTEKTAQVKIINPSSSLPVLVPGHSSSFLPSAPSGREGNISESGPQGSRRRCDCAQTQATKKDDLINYFSPALSFPWEAVLGNLVVHVLLS